MNILRRFPPRFLILVLSACLALALAPAPAWPDPVQFEPGPVFRVDTPRPGALVLGQPQAAMAPGIGCTLVAWLVGGPNQKGQVVWARQVCSSSLTSERALARSPGTELVDFSLSAGWYHYAITWSTFDAARNRMDFFARVFDLHARPIGRAFRIDISAREPGEELFLIDGPKVGIDDSGRLVIAWLEKVETEGPDFFRVRARRYALDGTPGMERVVAASPGSGLSLALAVAPGGSYMVAWEAFEDDPAETAVALGLYGPDDSERQVAFQPGSAPGACLRPAIESPALVGGYHGFFVAFVGGVGQSPQGVNPRCVGVFAQVYDLAGALLRGEFRVKRSAWSPLVQHDRSEFLVTWQAGPISGLPAPGGAPSPGAYAHPYAASGFSAGSEQWIQEQEITGLAFQPGSPLLVWLEDGVLARYLTQRP